MKKSKSAALPLATYWMPPPEAGEPIACLASTYTFHAALFEDELLPRFLGLRFDATERERLFVTEREERLAMVTSAVFVDVAHIDGRQTTGRWSQVPVRVPSGCQHSKVTILVWEQSIRVLVSSANLTSTGYRTNREMAASLDFFNGDGSASRELLTAVLDFFEDELIDLGQMPPQTKARLLDEIVSVRKRADGWDLPAVGSGLPSVTFIPVAPKRGDRVGRSVMDPLLEAWGSKRATEIDVMTPFVGDSAEGVSATIKELLRIPRTRDVTGHLILGGRPSEANDGTFVVNLPIWFRDGWAKAWKTEPEDISCSVIPPQREGEAVERALHAKAIVVMCEERWLLLIGSSNFSPHGLGIGVFNLEANLCYVVRDSDHAQRLNDALPVDWEADGNRALQWPTEPEPVEDDPAANAPAPPMAFRWATFNETTGLLTIAIDSEQPLPVAWSIWISGHDAAVFDSERDVLTLNDGQLLIALSDQARTHRLTCIVVRWIDLTGVSQAARLPTLVNDPAELLPPAALQGLRSDDIVACLLSGKDPAEWADDDDDNGERRRRDKSDKSFDLLRTIDTDSYVLYRTRQRGRALAALSQRILGTLRTPIAMRYRLEHDPLGPLRLARLIATEGGATTGPSRSAALFDLAELMLTLSYVARTIDANGKLKLRPIFADVIASIDTLARTFEDTESASSLMRYVESVRGNSDLTNKASPHAG